MTYRIDEMSWVEFDERRKNTNTVIIPTGAVEIYGPHLPMGEDGIAAMGVAERIAEKTGALIAPMMPVSDSKSLMAYPGTITVSSETFKAVMEDIVECLVVEYGFKNLLFITGHGGSVGPINQVGVKYTKSHGIHYAQVDWWRFVQPNGMDIFEEKGQMAHGHASEAGTSVMLYFRPELVVKERMTRVELNPKCFEYPDIMQYFPMDFRSPNATVGDATKGTAEKGKAIIDKCVDRIVEFMNKKWDI